MPKFDIWEEGYRCTGEFATAWQVASQVEGRDFLDAVENWYRKAYPKDPNLEGINISREKGVASIWACRLFDNEADARKSFG